MMYLPFLLLQQDSFQRLLLKLDGNRADWEYPFAVAGINISFMLIQMLDLQSGTINFYNQRLFDVLLCWLLSFVGQS